MAGKTYFVSGGSRGIGNEFVKQLSANPENKVITTARNPASCKDLQNLVKTQENVYAIPLDISNRASIDALDEQLKDIAKDGIDVLIQNAAISKATDPALETTEELYLEHYKTNVLGPIFLTKTLLKYLKLKDTKQLVYISSLSGAITDAAEISSSAYGQSKAALNYSVKEMSWELRGDGFTAISLHPGVVSTDLSAATFEEFMKKDPNFAENFKSVTVFKPHESVKSMLDNVILNLTMDQSGNFFNYDGKKLNY